ncbi:AMP-binding enzyme family protein [Paraburkholderia xenovorans LB400]|uniref:AMP-binding enzyme n=1 Tax=Paraburkholderia xenovorans (strain LB400) TaxID=266265 RepID=Q13PB4_PARXL|nr:class I adenylate-forming enzyme family protein [Paraburkholderia xenovorans]ABE34075.1 Putative AMP-binding enzyme [Paraburkholderia xenovorans LB400]AIP37301.1 AMP-binding enzyme family protein [Paraburkholderia xenovorans LB400]
MKTVHAGASETFADLPAYEIVARWAALIPEALALSDSGTSLNYAQLGSRIEATAGWLHTLGIQAGDRVMLVGENSVALATLILGAHRAGVTVVLENARRAPAETDTVHAHCAAHAMLFVLDRSPDAAAHAKRLGATEAIDAPAGRVAVRLEATARGEPADEASAAAIIYTTGTTGKPKGVMLSSRALSFIGQQMRVLRHVTPRDTVYGVLPITHVMGLASVLFGTLASGAHLHLVSRFSAAECVACIGRLHVSMLQGAPAMFARLVDHCQANGITRIEGVRFIGSGGAPIDPTIKKDAQRLFDTPLHNGYGLTEAASTCWTRFEDDNSDDTVGRPLPGVELRIAAPPGSDIGELWVRGPHVMNGYFRDPLRTSEVLTGDGWFNTQDLARQSADGRIYIVGRTRDIIIRSGFNVYPLEIELALATHPDVLHCAVLGRPVKGNEEIIAFVELTQNACVKPETLLAWLSERLSPYKRPAQIVVMATLPVAANGKVLKSALVVPHA